MGVSVPLLISTWLLAQQPGSPAESPDGFDIEGRDFSAQTVGSAAFLNVGPVPITSTFQAGSGALQLVASERIGRSGATYGDVAELRASLRIGPDEIIIELIQAGFPPLASFPEGARTAAVPAPPYRDVNGGVRVGGWVHGSTEAGFLWGGRAPAAFSVYGVGRVSVNGQVISERAIIQAHALTSGRFSDDERHLLQPALRPGDLEVQVIATNLPRSVVPGGFVELHFDDVSIATPEGTLADAQLPDDVAGSRPGQVLLESPRAGGLVFNLPAQLPGIGGSGGFETSGAALSGSGPVFGTPVQQDPRGFLSGTGPAFGTPPTSDDFIGSFGGEGPIFDPSASPRVGGGASEALTVGGLPQGGANPADPGEPAATTPQVRISDPALAEPSTGGAEVADPGAILPGTPARGRLVGEQEVVVGGAQPVPATPGIDTGTVADGTIASTRADPFGPGVNPQTFGPQNGSQTFGPGASGEVFGPGAEQGSAGTARTGSPFATQEGVFAGVPESTPGVPATPAPLTVIGGPDLPLRPPPLNATPAVPRVQTVSPLNSQPATPLLQDGIAPLNSLPAGATPPPVGTAAPTPSSATAGAQVGNTSNGDGTGAGTATGTGSAGSALPSATPAPAATPGAGGPVIPTATPGPAGTL